MSLMTKRWKIVLGAGVIVVGTLLLSLEIGWRRQQRALTAQIDRLRSMARAAGVLPSEPLPSNALPVPVARYLRWALRTNADIQEVRITQTGTLRTDVRSERWMPFDAEHVVVPRAAGFVWNARVSVAPLVHVRVRDALVAGRGSGRVALLSAFTVGADADTPQMNAGALHRYLAEAVWYPVALQPSTRLRWKEIDGTRALATLTDHGVTVSLEFRFAETGEISGIYTPARWGRFTDGYRQVPWEGHFRDYQERDGMVVPTEGDVGWYVDDKWQAVWKGRITAFEVLQNPAAE
jgi:hypothetical protein